jgi:hypothetical protein
MKVDIEGAEPLCLAALAQFSRRPKYISIEAGLGSMTQAFSELSHFWSLGYRSFKIVNQALNYRVRCPNPPLEGKYVPAHFDGHTSGPFGEEAPGAWMGIEEVLDRYRALIRRQSWFGGTDKPFSALLRQVYNRSAPILRAEPFGWYDIHAKLGPTPAF